MVRLGWDRALYMQMGTQAGRKSANEEGKKQANGANNQTLQTYNSMFAVGYVR
jgi:hypothetical protein